MRRAIVSASGIRRVRVFLVSAEGALITLQSTGKLPAGHPPPPALNDDPFAYASRLRKRIVPKPPYDGRNEPDPYLGPVAFPIHDRHAVDPEGLRHFTLEEPPLLADFLDVLSQSRRLVGPIPWFQGLKPDRDPRQKGNASLPLRARQRAYHRGQMTRCTADYQGRMSGALHRLLGADPAQLGNAGIVREALTVERDAGFRGLADR